MIVFTMLSTSSCLQGFLHKIGFVASDSHALTVYMSNLNVLFANKKCQDVLTRARALMKQELYNTVTLTPGDDPSNWANFVARYSSVTALCVVC